MTEPVFDPMLDAVGYLTRTLYARVEGAPRIMRLSVDYKDPSGTNCCVDVLANIPQDCTTKNLVERVQNTLPQGCTLSALVSVDHMRPIFVSDQFLKEEFGGRFTPEAFDAALTAKGFKRLTLEELKEEPNHD